ncbi:uncharacterized protein LOC142573874 [Dermacentor variabilis]|uniref:uncharacterized protein LOC142573874 n=1 Tax=Dermacentor variabilis TaxID=34621 RepID=UPI003F5BD7D5
MRIEKARIEAELDILQHEKEAVAANAQANALEAAVEQDGGERMRTLPPVDRTLQTRSYIDEQQALRNSTLVLTEEAVTNSSGNVNNAHTAPDSHTAAYNSLCLQADERPPDYHAAPNNPSYKHAGATSRPMDLRVDPQPLVHAPAHNSSSSELADVLKFLCRKDLVSSGLIKFDDRPENFRAWKSSFKGVVRDLGLSAQEELDLLIKWHGPESSRQARRLKSVHVDDFSTGLNVVWKRLDDVFGRPEAIEDALLKRLEDFPKISYRENTRLQELGDLLLELEAAKTDPYLAGLGYLDTSMSGEVKFPLPPLLEFKAIPENRDEIPTPDAARHYPHLKSVANHIPPLEEAGILLLLGGTSEELTRSRLPNNREQALSRLLSLRRTLRKNPETRERFVNFMNKLFIKGHAEEAPPLHVDEECWYLPIFGVHHPQKPDQIRVVFDSSAQYEGVSLNNVLLTGPDLTNNLVGILIRFRQEPFAVTADVQQMFYSFMVREDHQNYLRFLWFKGNDISREIVECRMKVHVFGNSPSPAVATYGLRRTAQQAAPRFGEDARKFVERDFYVDDALKSLPSEEDAISLLQRAQKMLATANIRLHKIALNRQNVLNAFPREDHARGLKNLDFGTDASLTQRSLGLLWDIGDDSFVFRAPRQDRPYTRRGVLSTVNSLYDPLGFMAPITVQGKYLLRDLVTKGYNWDTPLSDEKKQRWDEWENSLQELQHLHVQRTYAPVSTLEAERRDIHVFSDASTRAVAAVAYLRVTDKQGNRHAGFVMGKAKLAPQPEHTIPRLELCAAVLAVEMTDSILRELDFQPNSVTFYTDSKVVFGYIYNETRRFYVYVANRVQQIRSSTQPEQWKYVHTDENPADHATRAIPAAHLKSTNWLSGPDFLSRREEEARSSSFILLNPDEDKEIRSEVCTLATEVNKRQRLGAESFHRFSNWKSLTRAIASLIQVAHRAKNASQGKVAPVEALSKARLVIIRAVQQDAFYEEICRIQRGEQVHKTSSLRRLDPSLDANGLFRVGSRLNRSDLPDDEKHPLLLPGRHHVATLLVRHHHECVQHQGRHFTEGAVRAAGYWNVGGKRCISSVLQACISCKKLRGRFHDQKMADLPADRISTDPPFTNVGIDVFGPWMIASRRTRGGVANSKRWAVMFTCLSIRAVHIELIESMDTSSFINAFRRFLAVRGPIKLIRSDWGTNFIGACRELGISAEGIHRSQIGKFFSGNGCKWIFNPPHASHMGGAWERMIGIARRILDSMLMQSRHQRLTHDILATFLAEVTAIINARPITPTSSDPEDPTILTPATLLTQKHGSASVTIGQLDTSNLYKRHWRLVQNLADEFWKLWRSTYVTTLQQRRKWQAAKPDLKEGDVVLLRDKEATRNDWPVGVITRSLPSADGRVHKVELKTAKNGVVKTFFRPTKEVVRLL